MIFFQRDLIFLFIISISLHYLRTVSGFFLLNNDDSFNVFGLLKNNLDFFFHLQSLDIVIHNEIRHQSLRTGNGRNIGICRKWVWRGFQTFKTDEQEKSFGFQYTFLPLNLLIFVGVHAETSASSKCLSQ